MKQKETSYFEWTQKYATEDACRALLEQVRWGDGFICPKCGHDQAWQIAYRSLRECKNCRRQTSVTAGTMFDHSKVGLPKWFAAIYLMGTDKGGVSALRLSKMIGVNWRTARLMLTKLRAAMADRDGQYLLDGLVELDDAFVGGRRPGKRGRGAEGRKPVIFAVSEEQDPRRIHGRTRGRPCRLPDGQGILRLHQRKRRGSYRCASIASGDLRDPCASPEGDTAGQGRENGCRRCIS